MATLRLGLKVVTYPGKCKRLGTSLPCFTARGRRLAVRIGQVIEKGGAARALGPFTAPRLPSKAFQPQS